ncbi:MAG: FHA domain-containing protein, partial [Planctomycetota bacterium]|nr:FHA domain-containing protein [Planctomycetota bacterium]
MPKVIALSGPLVGREIVLTSASATLGRDPSQTIAINDHEISRSHAEIRFEAGRWFLRDLGSRNGTFINQQPLTANQMYELADGCVFSLGASSFRFVADAPQPAPYQAGTSAPAAPSPRQALAQQYQALVAQYRA